METFSSLEKRVVSAITAVSMNHTKEMISDIDISITDNKKEEKLSLTLIGYDITIKQLLEITKKGADEEQTNLRTSGRKRLFSPLRKRKK